MASALQGDLGLAVNVMAGDGKRFRHRTRLAILSHSRKRLMPQMDAGIEYPTSAGVP